MSGCLPPPDSPQGHSFSPIKRVSELRHFLFIPAQVTSRNHATHSRVPNLPITPLRPSYEMPSTHKRRGTWITDHRGSTVNTGNSNSENIMGSEWGITPQRLHHGGPPGVGVGGRSAARKRFLAGVACWSPRSASARSGEGRRRLVVGWHRTGRRRLRWIRPAGIGSGAWRRVDYGWTCRRWSVGRWPGGNLGRGRRHGFGCCFHRDRGAVAVSLAGRSATRALRDAGNLAVDSPNALEAARKQVEGGWTRALEDHRVDSGYCCITTLHDRE